MLVFAALGSASGQSPVVSRAVAITFDDLPGVVHDKGSNLAAIEDLNRKLLAALAKHKASATGFVIEQKVEEDDPNRVRASILELWPKAGMSLGNHTYSHPDYNLVPAAVFQRDLYSAEATIRPLMEKYHQKLVFFRYPYNHLGQTADKKASTLQFLADHHYEVATCTVENSDWMFDVVYHDAIANHDKAGMQRLREAYVEYTRAAFEYFEKRSRTVEGREIPQVLLLHANQLNADFLDDVLSEMESRGYRFKTLSEVQSDPAYRDIDLYVGEDGRMWSERWAIAKKIKPDTADVPKPATWILNEYYRLTH